MRRAVLFPLAVGVLLGCQDRDTPTSPEPQPPGVLFAISDAENNEGNPHFYWLPQLVPQPSFDGTANLALAPRVRVCEMPTAEPCASGIVADFLTGGAIQVVDEHYQLDLDTEGLGLTLDATYRIWVLLGSGVDQQAIGFADVYIAANGREAQTAEGGTFGLVDGRTLPLRWRMELGVTGVSCDLDCAEFTATNDGFEECTVNAWACLTAPPGWLPAGFEDEQVTIQIARQERVAGACFEGLPLPHDEGCYTIDTNPDFNGAFFSIPIGFGWCQVPNLAGSYEGHQRTNDGEVRRLQAAGFEAEGLDCSDFSASGGGVLGFNTLRKMTRPVTEFLFGSPLFAKDNLTSQVLSFSEFFYAPGVEVELVTDMSVTFVGASEPTVVFRIVIDHSHDGSPAAGTPVAGVEVQFAADDGVLSATSAISDASGEVSVDWLLPEADGTYTLTATVPVLTAVDPADAPSAVASATVGDPLVIDFAAIFARVLTNGDPVSGQEVSALGPLEDEPFTPLTQTTDGSGETVFENLDPDTDPDSWFVFTFADNQDQIATTVSLANANSAAAVTFDILPNGGGCDNGILCGLAVEAEDNFTFPGFSDLTLTASPFDFGEADPGASVTWASSDISVATVDQSGTVTGVAPGTATITATATLNGVVISAGIPITVFSVPN